MVEDWMSVFFVWLFNKQNFYLSDIKWKWWIKNNNKREVI